MASRGQEKRNQWEAYKKNNNIDGNGGTREMVLSIISIGIAAAAFIVSIFAIYLQTSHADREYEYKLDAELEFKNDIWLQVEQIDGERIEEVGVEEIKIEILRKNNLHSAYLIDANDIVTRLQIDEVENTINATMNESLKVDKADITIKNIKYYYKILVLYGLDDEYAVYLIYAKSENNVIDCKSISGIELLTFEKAHQDDVEYEGERQMAEKYKEILGAIKTYSPE